MSDADTVAVTGDSEGQPSAGATSATFCVRLWQHMRLEADGTARVCCLYRGGFVEQDGAEVSAHRQSLMEIWNADTMRDVRRAMVEGRRIAGCELCSSAEARGVESTRQVVNRNWERGWLDEPKATINEMMALAVENDFHLPKLPDLIEFQVSSLCNLKCRMCFSTYSSKIANDKVQRSWELKEYFPRDDPTVRWLKSIENLVDELANDTGSEVKRLNLMGGEPLLLREIPRLLARLIAAGRAQSLSLEFISNGSVVPRWLSLAPQFRCLFLAVSVDGHADHYDYIRYPGRWSKLIQNFQLFKNTSNVYCSVTTTVQVNNVLHLADLFRYLDSVDISFAAYLLDGPRHLAVNILPSAIRRLAAARLTDYAATDCRPAQRAQVVSLAAQFEEGDDAGTPRLLRDFMLFTNDLDASRGQSIHRSDPELVELLEQAGYPWLHDTLHAPAASVSEESRQWRLALAEARNAAATLRQELLATRRMLHDESAQTRGMLMLDDTQAEPVRRELARVRQELAEVHASPSWRVTGPLRAAGRRFRRWLPGIHSYVKSNAG